MDLCVEKALGGRGIPGRKKELVQEPSARMSEHEMSEWMRDRLAQADAHRAAWLAMFEMPDAACLRRYLAAQMPAASGVAVRNLERVAYGSSREHYIFEASWTERGQTVDKNLILLRERLIPPDMIAQVEGAPAPDPMLFWIRGKGESEREFRLLKALEQTVVPAPRAWWLDTSGEWLQRPFMVQERVPGQVSPSFTWLGLEDSAQKAAIGHQFVDILAAIHSVDWRGVGLDFLGVPAAGVCDYADAAIEALGLRLAAYAHEWSPLLQRALDWLRARRPRMETVALCHGDYKTDNVMFEGGRINAILDWDFAHLGDPVEDLGWVCLGLFSAGHLCMGFLPREELLARYESRTGRPVDRERLLFWEVFNSVRMVSFCHAMFESSKRRLQMVAELQLDIELPDPEPFHMSMINRLLDDLRVTVE